jgi:hypothetical protein
VGQVRKGMHVHSSDRADLGKVAEVWLGTDPASATARCDEEVCSRVEVRRGLLRKQVLYVPYSGIADVSGDTVTLGVNESGRQAGRVR